MSLVKWRTGKNSKNLTEKLKIADMAKDHKKVDWNLIETRWDVPGQMANLAQTAKTWQERWKWQIWPDHKKVDWNFIEGRWDDPRRMANRRKPVGNGENYESGKKNQQRVDGILTEGPRDFSGKMTNVTKVAISYKYHSLFLVFFFFYLGTEWKSKVDFLFRNQSHVLNYVRVHDALGGMCGGTRYAS